MKTKSSELEEASYLQTKLTPITADEVLDFHLAMTLGPTFDGFIGHCEHDRVTGLHNLPPSHGRGHRQFSLLFHCASCHRDFIAERRDGKPVCPECGRDIFVDEAKYTDYYNDMPEGA